MQFAGMNPAAVQSNQDGLVEVASILAVGLQRVLERKSSQNLTYDSNSLLDCAGLSGGDVTRKPQEVTP